LALASKYVPVKMTRFENTYLFIADLLPALCSFLGYESKS
jgi:hypothetical protein